MEYSPGKSQCQDNKKTISDGYEFTADIRNVPNRVPSNLTIQGPTNGVTNNYYKYIFNATDEDNDTLKYNVNWGDTKNDSSKYLPNEKPFTTTHVWTEAGEYSISAYADDNKTSSETVELNVSIVSDTFNIGLFILGVILLLILILFLMRKKKGKIRLKKPSTKNKVDQEYEFVIDKVDKDIGKVYNGSASLDSIRISTSDSTHYWDIGVNATGQMTFSYNGTKKAHVATSTGSWVEVQYGKLFCKTGFISCY